MSRTQLLALSGLLALARLAPMVMDGWRAHSNSYITLIVGIVLWVLVARDLHRRGWTWQAQLVGVLLLVMPMIGFFAYYLASDRPLREPSFSRLS